MRKAKIASIVLIVFVVLSIYLENIIDDVTNDLISDTNKVIEKINKEEWKEANDLANSLYIKWDKKEEYVSAVIEHDVLENALIAIRKGIISINLEEKETSLSQMEEFKYLMELIAEVEKVKIKNVL